MRVSALVMAILLASTPALPQSASPPEADRGAQDSDTTLVEIPENLQRVFDLVKEPGFHPELLELLELGATQERAEGQLYSWMVFEEGYDVTVTEVERGPNFSLIVMTIRESPTVTASGVILGKAQFDLAKELGFEYFFLAPRPREGGAGNAGTIVGKVFFTNDNTVPLQELLGDEYSERAQALFDRRGYPSVSQMAVLFGGSRQGVSSEEGGRNREWSAAEEAYFAAMKSDLRNLVSLQETRFAEHGGYTHDVESLGFRPSFGGTLVVSASALGWAAAAAHEALGGGEACAIYYGSATAPTSPARPTEPGTVACTGGRQDAPQRSAR